MLNPSRRDVLAKIGASITSLAIGANARGALPIARPAIESLSEIGIWHSFNVTSTRYLTLPIKINGVQVPALIASGTTTSIVNYELALSLGLESPGRTSAWTPTRNVEGLAFHVGELDLDVTRLHDITLASYDLTQVEILDSRDIPVIIGQDILREVDFEVDFIHGISRFISPSLHRQRPDFTTLQLKGFDRVFPSIPISFGSNVHHDALVDVGGDTPLLMSAAYVRETGLFKDRLFSTTMTVDIGGGQINKILSIPYLEVGPFKLKDVPVVVAETWQYAQPIYIGWPLFAAFDLILSLQHKVIHLKPDNQKMNDGFPKDRSGLGIERRANSMIVRHVASNSPASRAGILVEDQIVAIDGHAISSDYPPPGERMGQKPAGTEFHLTMLDGRDLLLVLADYF